MIHRALHQLTVTLQLSSEQINWHRSECRSTFEPKREEKETCRHWALSAIAVSHWWFKLSQWFTSAQRLNNRPGVLSLFFFSPPTSSFSYYFAPSLHSSLCSSPHCFLLANCCCAHTWLFFHWVCTSSLCLKVLVVRPPGRSKKKKNS